MTPARCTIAVAMLLALVASCATRPAPETGPTPGAVAIARTPVVVIPGLTGTRLRDTETNRFIWGKARTVFAPRDAGYSAALPLDPQSPATRRVEPVEPIWNIKIAGLFPVRAYGAVAGFLEDAGYELGDLAHPTPDATLFFFNYDWREDSVSAARLLGEQLESLRRVRGEATLHVDLICQSSGGQIGRWFVKYGGATVEQAASAPAPPAGVVVDRLILVGTANGGSLRVLQMLNRGRRYVPGIGRLFSPELFFTFRSLFDGLPGYTSDLFLDATGGPIRIDVFDASTWELYGWSIYGREAGQRLARRGTEEVFGDVEQRRAYLGRQLERARAMQSLLLRDVQPAPPTRYYLIQNAYDRTPARAVLLPRRDGEWVTAFPGDRQVRKRTVLRDLTTGPGDGHATVDSQMTLSWQEHAAMAAEPYYVPEAHFRVILDPMAQRRIVEYLARED